MKPLLLASRSAVRLQMLLAAGVSVEPAVAPLDEEAAKAELKAQGCSPAALASELSIGKARSLSAAGDRLVLGADQTLELDGEVLDKPGDLDGLQRQLRLLRGRAHQLHAGAAIVRAGEVVWSGLESATLTMRAFSDTFLAQYLKDEGRQVFGCAGGYRLEAMGAQLFEKVDGDYFTVLGLPLLPLLAGLRCLQMLPE